MASKQKDSFPFWETFFVLFIDPYFLNQREIQEMRNKKRFTRMIRFFKFMNI